MAGNEWCWCFWLDGCADGAFMLSATQTMTDPDDQDDAYTIEPAASLRTGADIYEHLEVMLADAGEDIEMLDLDGIASELSAFSERLADQFRRGKALLARRQRRRERGILLARSAAIEPLRQAIDAYCANLDDNRPRGGGGISRPSERSRVQAFLEDYVRTHGQLPVGRHSWTLSNGFLSGSHDFAPWDNF